MTEKIGVVIPHFNSDELIGKLINSINVNSSDNKNIEIVIIDDCSDIRSFEKLKEFITPYQNIKLIRNDKNKGAGYSRNVGLSNLVESEWVLFADSDDYFSGDFSDLIREAENSDEDIIFFKSHSVFITTGEDANRHQYINSLVDQYLRNKDYESELLLRYHWVMPVAKMFKLDFIRKNHVKFDEVKVSNDTMFSMKTAYYAKKIKVIDKVIYIATKSSGSLTTTMSKENYIIRSKIMIDRADFLSKKLTKKEMKTINLSYGKWLVTGLVVYKINVGDLLKVWKEFSSTNMSFFPKLSKLSPRNILKFLRSNLIDKNLRKISDE